MHPGQLRVDVSTVRSLLVEQFPQWAGHQVHEVRATGTVNALFRIGAGFAARFALLDQDPDEALASLRREAQASREFGAVSGVPTPEVVAIGRPGHGYPLPWCVQVWLPGHDATVEDPGGSMAFAHDLAALIARLRGSDTRGRRYDGVGRGGHLSDHDHWVEQCLERSGDLLDVPRLRELWQHLRSLPEVEADTMCHRDLTPPNVLVKDGRLVGVLDAGTFGPADPAVDLVAAWHLLEEHPRAALRHQLQCSDVQWQRGMAWAFEQALGLVWYYLESSPPTSRWGRRTLDRIVAAEGA